MPLDETDRLILMADAIYDSVSEKLRYVNYKKGLLLPNGEVDPLRKKQAMTKATFYRKLKAIGETTIERMYEVAKNFQADTLDQHELLKKLEKDKLQMLELCRAKKDYSGANRIGDSVIAMQPYLAGIKESIKDIMENDIGSAFKDSVSSKETANDRGEKKGRRVLAKASRKGKTT